MTKTQITRILKQYLIINTDNSLNIRFQSKLNKLPELIQMILDYTIFLQYSAPIKARLHCILKDITQQPTCSQCNTAVKMRLDGKYIYTFPTFCSSKCIAADDTIKEKRRQTNMKKHGVANVLQRADVKQKTKDLMMEKYGVDNSLKSKEVRDKIKQTNLEKYGHENPLDNEDIRNKAKATLIEKYGVDNPLKSKEVRDKIKQTNLEKYGHENIFGSEHGQRLRKDGMLDAHGVEYPIQKKELLTKMLRTTADRYLGEDSPPVSNPHQAKMDPQALLNIDNKDWMLDQHISQQKTFQRIAAELGISDSVVGDRMKHHGIDPIFNSSSQGERDMADYIKQLIPTENVITNTRDLISPKEVDVYLPSFKLAFEYNGVYWHGENQGKERRYHLNKLIDCAAKGVRLVQITDTEWNNKQEIVKSRISSMLGVNKVIYARKTKIVVLNFTDSSKFFNKTHIQGSATASVGYGLEYEGKLVAAMSFSKSRFSKKYEWELIRYSNDLLTNVVGGASRLFSHFTRMKDPASIVTYSDRRWNTGGLYSKLGFTFMHQAKPNYYYFRPTNTQQLFHRVKFQKHKLEKVLAMFSPEMTEWQNMQRDGYDRIWDCGNDVFKWENENIITDD